MAATSLELKLSIDFLGDLVLGPFIHNRFVCILLQTHRQSAYACPAHAQVTFYELSCFELTVFALVGGVQP